MGDGVIRAQDFGKNRGVRQVNELPEIVIGFLDQDIIVEFEFFRMS